MKTYKELTLESVQMKNNKWVTTSLNSIAILKKQTLYNVWYFDGYGLEVVNAKTDEVITMIRADMSFKQLVVAAKKYGLTINKSSKLVIGLVPDKGRSSLGGAEIYD